MENQLEYKQIRRKLLIVFTLAVTIVIVVALYLNYRTGNYILSNNQLAPIINKSGKQRSLSQNIAKTIYLNTLSTKDIDNIEFDRLMSEFTTSHRYLKDWNLKNLNDVEIIKLYEEIEPYFVELSRAKDLLQKSDSLQRFDDFMLAESNFLRIMNQITNEFEDASRGIIEDIRRNVFLSNYLTGLAVILSASIVFILTIRTIRKYSRDLTIAGENLNHALESEQRKSDKLQFLTETLSVGVWENDRLEKSEKWSPQMYSILGLENNEVLGTSENFIKRVHPSDREKLLTASERSIKTGIASRLELRVLTSDDSYKWIEASGNVKLNEVGNPTLLIGGVADITKRKILELQLKNFVEYAPAYIAMFDRHMNYLIASALWCEFFGLDANEIKGKSAIKVNGTKNQVTSKSNEERWRKIHEKGLQGKEATIKAEKFILDNTEYMIDWKIKPWYVDKNEVGGIIIKLADVTEYIKK